MRPESILSVVVLPAPLGPRKPTNSPSAMVKLMPSAARISSNSRRNSPFTPPQKPGCFL